MTEQFENGITGRIIQDSDSQNPLEDYSGDANVFVAISIPRYFEWPPKNNRAGGVAECRALLAGEDSASRHGWHVFPLFAYVHSGIAFSLGREYPFNCQWDSGVAGCIALNPADWAKREDAERYAACMVNTLNQYCSGDVWGYEIQDRHGECLDSCWGFFGQEYALEEMRSAARYWTAKQPEVDREEFYRVVGA